jgi:hypothetical protein
MDKAITNYNDKRQYHGYQETYNWNKKIWYRGNWKNKDFIGYLEDHNVKQTNFHIR